MAMKRNTIRRPRVPVDHGRLEVILPNATINRISDHVARNGDDVNNFLKKAIYDALPVHYEVTEEWTFPFGKYTGETAGTVKQLDPAYIKWCEQKIAGFHNKMKSVDPVEAITGITPDLRGADTLSMSIDVSKATAEWQMEVRMRKINEYRRQLRADERLVSGASTPLGIRMFAKARFANKFRFLGYLPD